MRFPLVAGAFLAVSACSPSIPDSAAGVGFNDYNTYEQEKAARDAALAGATPVPSSTAISGESANSQILASAIPVDRSASVEVHNLPCRLGDIRVR